MERQTYPEVDRQIRRLTNRKYRRVAATQAESRAPAEDQVIDFLLSNDQQARALKVFLFFKDYGSERRSSLSKLGTPGRRLFGRQLTNNTDSEQALASAMGGSKYGRMNRRWDDSDDASETSSICSERSFSSSIGGTRVTEVRVSDLFNQLTLLF